MQMQIAYSCMATIGCLPCVWVELFTEDMGRYFLLVMFNDGSSSSVCCHSEHSLTVPYGILIPSEKKMERITVVVVFFFTTILNHMALVTPGHNCQEDGCPITTAVIGTLGGPNQYHIPCLLCTSDLPCFLNPQLLSGSGESSSYFISSLAHGHAVQHRSTAVISKISETVWKKRRLMGIMKQNMKLQLCPKNKVSMTNQVSIRQATSLKDIKSDIIKLQNSP